MMVDRIIVGNVNLEQRLFFKARKLDVGLYHVMVPVSFFVQFSSKEAIFMRDLLHLLPSRRRLPFRQCYNIR
jgi:hypothetical protein